MTDIAVIILTKDEELHIGRCLERIAALSPRQVFVVDCFSTDGTQRIVEEWKSGGVGEWRSEGVSKAAEFRRRALEKVEEWLADVSEERFVAALDALLDANLTEVTFEASSKRAKKAPRLMPLAEAVETVVHRQVAAGSNPSTQGSIPNAALERKGGGIVLAEHEWPGLYAVQFNWALDNLPIEAKWVLRLDADEYLTPETIERLKEELPKLSDDVSGLTLELKRRFMGGEILHGTNGIRLLRIFKHGIGRCEERAMDEHIVLSEGRCIDFNGAFYDDNLNTFEWWQEKHRGYAKREAMDAISLFNNPERLKNPSATDRKKIKYYRWPPYMRAFAYFFLRYVVKRGFLDGRAGWRWHFWQGLWYRWIMLKSVRPFCIRFTVYDL